MHRTALRAIDHVLNDPRRTAVAILVDWVVCSWTYSLLEGKGPIEGLWWGIVTGSTVGYGDFYPDSTAGRGVGAFLIVSMWGLAVVAGSHFVSSLVRDPNAFTHEEQVDLARCTHDTERLVRENHQMLRRVLELRGEDPGSRTGTTTTAHHGQEPA